MLAHALFAGRLMAGHVFAEDGGPTREEGFEDVSVATTDAEFEAILAAWRSFRLPGGH